MAVHGALTNPGPPRGGYLASVRGVRLHVARLDDVAGDLVCEASRIAADGAAVLYRFSLYGDGRELASGRAAIVFDASLQVTA
jgi:predicted hotdog family 3-hydroxylacyl-ACP dehydratase